jgi:putative DNA primase/helicase
VLQIGQHRPLNFRAQPTPCRPARRRGRSRPRRRAQVWSLLHGLEPHALAVPLRRAADMGRARRRGPAGRRRLTEERLRHMLARLARWVRMNAKGELVPAPPPTPCQVGAGHARSGAAGAHRHRQHAGLRPRRHAAHHAGLSPRRAAALRAGARASPCRRSRAPSPAEIAAARQLICEDLLGDFPFTGDAERAHVVALLLLGFLRGMIDGPTPLHLIEKPTPGTGATLMVDADRHHPDRQRRQRHDRGARRRGMAQAVTAKLRQIPRSSC